jgi:hypothetical protein
VVFKGGFDPDGDGCYDDDEVQVVVEEEAPNIVEDTDDASYSWHGQFGYNVGSAGPFGLAGRTQ